MTFIRRRRLTAPRCFDRARSERGVATVSLIVAGIVLVGATAAVTYVATDGFGQNAEPAAAPAPEQAPTPSASSVPSASSANEEDPAVSPMDAAFAAGQSVVCIYTHEGYEATTTLRSMDAFRIDQQTQGGPAYVIRTPEHALVWIDGMTEAMEFDTGAYEQAESGLYPTFDPSEFDIDALFTDGTCTPDSAAEDGVFELPANMTSAPATP